MLALSEWRVLWWDRSLWWRTYTVGGYDGYRTLTRRRLPCAMMDTALRRPDMRDEIRRLARTSSGLHAFLHRKGIARTLNVGTQSWTDQGTAYIEAIGSKRIATRLAMYALRHSSLIRPDWRTVRVVKIQQKARLRWRFNLAFRRL